MPLLSRVFDERSPGISLMRTTWVETSLWVSSLGGPWSGNLTSRALSIASIGGVRNASTFAEEA
jgi:hypothetical protein